MAKSEQLPEDFHIGSYWLNIKSTNRLPVLTEIVLPLISMPVTSVEVERSFSKTNQIPTPQRHNLSDENYTGLTAHIYFNGELSSG